MSNEPMPRELYVRQPDSDTARGPFTIEKLVSLVDAGQVDGETLYYDDEKDDWVNLRANDELRKLIFPERKRLALRKREQEELNLINKPEDEEASRAKPIDVDEMLAAAEGDTEDTRHLKMAAIWRDRTANVSIPLIGVLMFISAASNIAPAWSLLDALVYQTVELTAVFERPLLIVGVLDILLGIALFLKVTEIFPLLRFRAMVGMGYFGLFYWAQWYNGDPNALYAMLGALGGNLGIFICTLTLNFSIMMTGAILGVSGMVAFAYFTAFANLG